MTERQKLHHEYKHAFAALTALLFDPTNDDRNLTKTRELVAGFRDAADKLMKYDTWERAAEHVFRDILEADGRPASITLDELLGPGWEARTKAVAEAVRPIPHVQVGEVQLTAPTYEHLVRFIKRYHVQEEAPEPPHLIWLDAEGVRALEEMRREGDDETRKLINEMLRPTPKP